MHLPSRGLRLSATTMRKTGWFFAPMRFMRIFTAINLCFLSRRLTPALDRSPFARLLSKKRGEPRLEFGPWQGAFWHFFGETGVVDHILGYPEECLTNIKRRRASAAMKVKHSSGNPRI